MLTSMLPPLVFNGAKLGSSFSIKDGYISLFYIVVAPLPALLVTTFMIHNGNFFAHPKNKSPRNTQKPKKEKCEGSLSLFLIVLTHNNIELVICLLVTCMNQYFKKLLNENFIL